MASIGKTYDVFISHSAADAMLATEIAKACRTSGLDTVTDAELSADEGSLWDTLWDALAESRGVLIILSSSGTTTGMAIELGAARAWNKPIFGIVADPSNSRLPPGLSGISLYPAARIDDVIKAIKLSGQELSDHDRSKLAKLYSEIGMPVDQLTLDPKHRDHLVKRFHSQTGKLVQGERLLSELLRMRKQGKLLKTSAKNGPKTHKEIA
jgi:hypothetical protein